MSLRERCLDRIIIGEPSGCFEWDGTHNTLGYAAISRDGQSAGAHRVAFEVLRGPIPEGLEIDHLCRNRGCVNPWHMEPVTRRMNVLRSGAASATNARKTHCPKGHPYDGVTHRGARICVACTREANRRYQRAYQAREEVCVYKTLIPDLR